MNSTDKNNIDIHFIADPFVFPDDLYTILKSYKKHTINYVNWIALKNKPWVFFRIAYSDLFIFILFETEEINMRAEITSNNGNVFEDSCVEFFIKFDNPVYYNFEINANGAILFGAGVDKPTRKRIPVEEIEKIQKKVYSEFRNGLYYWDVVAAIPLSLFNVKGSLRGTTATANFYKCGDLTAEKHYLSWMPVKTELPNFHKPEFFGDVIFV